MSGTSLTDLNDHVLLEVFSYLRTIDIINLEKVIRINHTIDLYYRRKCKQMSFTVEGKHVPESNWNDNMETLDRIGDFITHITILYKCSSLEMSLFNIHMAKNCFNLIHLKMVTVRKQPFAAPQLQGLHTIELIGPFQMPVNIQRFIYMNRKTLLAITFDCPVNVYSVQVLPPQLKSLKFGSHAINQKIETALARYLLKFNIDNLRRFDLNFQNASQEPSRLIRLFSALQTLSSIRNVSIPSTVVGYMENELLRRLSKLRVCLNDGRTVSSMIVGMACMHRLRELQFEGSQSTSNECELSASAISTIFSLVKLKTISFISCRFVTNENMRALKGSGICVITN